MKSLLQHRARILVVLAMMATMTIGLSSCADTVTGTNEATIEASTQVNATEGVQTAPALGERAVDGSTNPISATPLLSSDSVNVEVDDEGRTQNGLKIIDRF